MGQARMDVALFMLPFAVSRTTLPLEIQFCQPAPATLGPK